MKIKIFHPDIFYPKIITTLKGYDKAHFKIDAKAGLIVALVALPLAIAFGIASGVSPQQGIITSIVAGLIASLLGGSRVQITGATGAMVVIISGVIASHGMIGLIVATVMAGVILVLMGLLKFGDFIRFMPYPITLGFTTGIAVLIFSMEIKDFFGLQIPSVPREFHEKWITYAQSFHTINLYALGIGLFTILVIFSWNHIYKKIPGTLVAIILTTAIVSFCKLPVETIGDRLAADTQAIAQAKLTNFSFTSVKELLPVAFNLAMLGAIVSLLSAMVADGALGSTHRANTELIAQGVANIVTPFFGGIPATGAIARTMTSVSNGGRTPVVGIVHVFVLSLILLVFGRWTKLIPMSCLAGIVIVVAYNMSDWRTFVGMFKNTRSEVVVLLVTFFLTVFFDLTIAIEIGILLALFLFVRRVSKTIGIQVVKNEIQPGENEREILSSEALQIPKDVDVFEIDGPFFFGIANKFEEAQKQVQKKPKVRIIRMRKVPFMDTTGLRNLRTFYKKCQHEKIQIILAGVNEDVINALKQDGLYDIIGNENIYDHIEPAMNRAKQIIENRK